MDRRPLHLLTTLALTLAATVVGTVAGTVAAVVPAAPAAAATGTFHNPVADVYDPTIATANGYYHLIGTSEDRHLQIRRSTTVAGLRSAAPVTVWSGPASGLGCCLLWSPVLQKVQGTWYVYLSVTNTQPAHTATQAAVYVLQGNATDPMGPYTLKAALKTWTSGVHPGPWEKGIVGPSVTEMPDGRLYFTSTTFGFYIQEMSNPWTLKPGTSMVTVDDGSPDFAWEGGTSEISRPFVRTVAGQTRVFLPYSSENHVTHRTNGGPCWSWCVGLFTNTDGNLLNPASWVKSPQPVFAGGPDTGLYRVLALGTFRSLDGTEDWLVYNASDAPGTDFGERDTFVQRFTFNADGTPNFGRPAPLTTALTVPSGETGSPPAVVPGSTLVSHDFASGAAGWTAVTGSWTACGGQYCATGGGENVATVGELGWADYTVQAAVTANNAPNGSGVNVLARVESAARMYNLELLKDAAGVRKWIIAVNRSGTWSVLASGAYNWEPGVKYWLRLDVNAGRLTGLISTDGVGFAQLGTHRQPDGLVGRAGSGDFGRPGLRTWGGLTARFDDVTVTANRPTYGFYTGAGWPGLTIDAGGSPAAAFCVNDSNEFCLGGNRLTTTSAVTTAGVTDPLPAAMYQSERWGDTLAPKFPGDDGSFRYVIPSLQPGQRYQLRLHFAELHHTAAARRSFDVRVNGTLALDEFDTYAAAGGIRRAVVREAVATADAYGHVTVAFLPGQAAGRDHNPAVSGLQIAPAVRLSTFARTDQQVTDGAYTRIYDPDVGGVNWYVNDHSIIRDAAGTWHLFGITDTEPPHAGGEQSFGHATAPSLTGPWTRQAPALTASPAYGETYLWAPHVIRDGSTYYMFYSGGGSDPNDTAINLATSTDLVTWTRRPQGPLFRDGHLARDPFITRVGTTWVMYYTATETPTGGANLVLYRTSTDLVTWSARRVAYRDPATLAMGHTTESPQVVAQGGWWYLFTGPRGTANAAGNPSATVYRSRDPFHFNHADRVGHLRAHAPEVVQDTGGQWYVSHAGWGEEGVWLAPLTWAQNVAVSGFTVTSPTYRATVVTSPAARVTELSVPVPGGGWRNTVEPDGPGTQPYLGVNAWGPTARAGAAASVTVTADGLGVTAAGIPLTGLPVTVDWTFRAGQNWLDTSYTWRVTGATSGVRELGWSLDLAALPTLNDNAGANRDGDVAGFPQWTVATDGTATVATAYRTGSAWSTANRWYGHRYAGESVVAWQSVWSPGGATVAAGTYAGGQFRIGVSATGNDTALAQRLHATLNG
jgi:GH43 family beta-xylosidase